MCGDKLAHPELIDEGILRVLGAVYRRTVKNSDGATTRISELQHELQVERVLADVLVLGGGGTTPLICYDSQHFLACALIFGRLIANCRVFSGAEWVAELAAMPDTDGGQRVRFEQCLCLVLPLPSFSKTGPSPCGPPQIRAVCGVGGPRARAGAAGGPGATPGADVVGGGGWSAVRNDSPCSTLLLGHPQHLWPE